MEEYDLKTVSKKAVTGIFTLTSRTFLVQLISFIATFLLTIYLSPRTFGIFAVVQAIISFLSYFSDIGLAAAVIQKKEAVSQDDLKTTFTIQQILILTLVIISYIFSFPISKWYGLDNNGLWLLRALIISFFLSSLKTIPSIVLERKLEFNKLVVPQLIEILVFNITAVVLASRGFGIQSLTFAVILRGITGTVAMYIISPWKISLGISKTHASGLLRFGIPFQANSLLALLKDDLLTVFLGKVLAFNEVGLLGWGQKWAFFPLRFIMDNIIKVTFPAYSRLQDNIPALRKAIEKSIFFITLITFPLLLGLCLIAPYLVNLIPRYSKWLPALLPLYFFSFNAALSSISTPLVNALNALGRIKTTLKLMVLWVVLTWLVTPLFIFRWGYIGASIASALISCTVFIPVYLMRKITPISVVKNIAPSIFSTFFMGGLVLLMLRSFGGSYLGLFSTVLCGAILYIGVLLLLFFKKIESEAKSIVKLFKGEKNA